MNEKIACILNVKGDAFSLLTFNFSSFDSNAAFPNLVPSRIIRLQHLASIASGYDGIHHFEGYQTGEGWPGSDTQGLGPS